MTEIFTFQVKYLIKSSNRQLNLADYHTNIVKLGKEFDLEVVLTKINQIY